MSRNLQGDVQNSEHLFKDCIFKESEDGYYYVDPMPSKEQLDAYYKNLYWDWRKGILHNSKNHGPSPRDLVHYHLLKKYIPGFFTSGKKTIVNFGAGGGGISNLFWFDGFQIINVEPSGVPQSYENNWKNIDSIFELEDEESSIDLLYGSHSLEHVHSIDSFMDISNKLLKDEAYMFWEIPNALAPKNGYLENRIHVPHTYYFTTKFFDKWFDKVLLNKCYDSSHRIELGIIENWEDYENPQGPVIRALGKMIKNK
jgi:hypothetical protein